MNVYKKQKNVVIIIDIILVILKNVLIRNKNALIVDIKFLMKNVSGIVHKIQILIIIIMIVYVNTSFTKKLTFLHAMEKKKLVKVWVIQLKWLILMNVLNQKKNVSIEDIKFLIIYVMSLVQKIVMM